MYPARPFKNSLTRETFFDRFFVYKHLAVKGLSMKKIFYVLPGLCLFASGAAAEAIDSVSFNPARLGRYETLKVSDQLTTKGGIEANAVTVQSGGTVSVNNTGNYKFPVTEVLGSVDMKSTDFEAVTLNSRGTASFENKSSSAESMITTLNTSTADVRANILDLTNVTVPDEDESSLRLGENDIPRPASVGLDNCSNLTWVERTTDDNYKYKVLAFEQCGNTVSKTPCPATCASGYVRNKNVQYEEDGECCIEQPTVYYFRCTGITSSPVMNTYDSFNDALNACESGADPNAFWVEALPSSRTPMNYQRCGTPENEAYVQSKTAYWYQTLQQLEKPIDPGDITLLQYMRYSCTTSCANCSTGGIGRFFECHCAYGVA